MPITSELDNLKKLESVGFSHEQAETLADVIEKSHTDSQASLKEFFCNELSKQIGSIDSNLSSKIASLDGNLSSKIADLDGNLSSKIASLDGKLSKEISNLRVEINKELKDLLIKIFGIIIGTVGIAVTILKLFP